MASCFSLTKLARACGDAGGMGGAAKLYMVAYNDLVPVSGSTEVYTLENAVDEVAATVTNIGVGTNKFVEIGVLPDTSGFNFELTKNNSTNTNYFTTNLPMSLAGLNKQARTFVASVRNQPVVALLQIASGAWFAIGLNGKFELNTATGGSGVAPGDLNGYTLNFSGADINEPYLVDVEILNDIIDFAGGGS